jgi:hypothetical protein
LKVAIRWVATNAIAGAIAAIIFSGLSFLINIGDGPLTRPWFQLLGDWAVFASVGAVFGLAQQRTLRSYHRIETWALRTTIGVLTGGLAGSWLAPRLLNPNPFEVRTVLGYAITAGVVLGAVQSIGFRRRTGTAIWIATTTVAVAVAITGSRTLYLTLGNQARILGAATQIALLRITLSAIAGLAYAALTAPAIRTIQSARQEQKI